jgi:hypothetical protein
VGQPGGQQAFLYAYDVDHDFELYNVAGTTVSDYPGSTVKLMTALLCLEYKSSVIDTEAVTVTAADLTTVFGGGLSSAGFMADDVTNYRGLLQGLLIPSGYDAAQCIARTVGSDGSGSGGMAGFVTRMNARAVELGMSTAVFVDPFGGSKTPTVPPYDVTYNKMSAKDLSKVARAAFALSTLVAIQGDTTVSVAVTGPNARSISMTNFSWWANMPILNPAGIRDTSVVAGKQGSWTPSLTAIDDWASAVLYQSPSGFKVVVVVMNSKTNYGLMLDARGSMWGLPRDFTYLQATASADPFWTSVKVLIGGDGSIVDESTVARTITVNSVTAGLPVSATPGAMVFNAVGDYVSAADAADLEVGSGDFTAEYFYCADTAILNPGGVFWVGKWLDAGNQHEWVLSSSNVFGNPFINASADGNSFTSATFDMGADAQLVFYNGAPRHMAYVKNGSTHALYMMGERMVNTFSLATVFDSTAAFACGGVGVNQGPRGRMDDVRFTVGVARYTAAAYTITPTKFPRS